MTQLRLSSVLAAASLFCVLYSGACSDQDGTRAVVNAVQTVADLDVTDTEAQAANVSVMKFNIYGGIHTPTTCGPNANPLDSNTYQNPNVLHCNRGTVQFLSNQGILYRSAGCFAESSDDLASILAARCTIESEDSLELSADDWVASKKRILNADPLKVHTVVNCQDANVGCWADNTTPTLTFSVDGKTNSISYPDVPGLPQQLATILDELSRIGFSY